jgi:hypothetical protein
MYGTDAHLVSRLALANGWFRRWESTSGPSVYSRSNAHTCSPAMDRTAPAASARYEMSDSIRWCGCWGWGWDGT